MNDTPRANRIHIAFFGLRNAGKSTLVNAFTGQQLAIVSEVAGTTTDPVSKAMEILPLGPCLITDTAGLDDVGALGEMRVRKSLEVLATTDIAVWVWGEEGERKKEEGERKKEEGERKKEEGERKKEEGERKKEEGERKKEEVRSKEYSAFLEACRARKVVVMEYRRGDSVETLKEKIAAVNLEERSPGLLDGLVKSGDRIVCVVPIDESAPKGRLILPQQQVIRECLDLNATCVVCQPSELMSALAGASLVITDSQAFGKVRDLLATVTKPPRLTSFSVLFARQKGDLAEFVNGLAAICRLQDGDTVVISEACTHHRQCNDIGSVKIPKALKKLSGRNLNFVFTSGNTFTLNSQLSTLNSQPTLVVHCGGCMITRREMLRRIGLAKSADVPIVNYGLVLAAANGLKVEDILV